MGDRTNNRPASNTENNQSEAGIYVETNLILRYS